MTRQSTAYSSQNALQAIGRAIHEIKAEDGLTWVDIGAVLGVSDDQAAKYAEGTAKMNAVTFGRGKRNWNGRFTGYFDRLCVESRPGIACREAESTVLKAVMAMSVALSDDNQISETEIRDNRHSLENARDAIDQLLGRIGVRGAA